MREQKVLSIKRKDGTKLLIVASHIYQVESVESSISRVYYSNDKQIDILRNIDWMTRFLSGNYDVSGADEA